MYLLRAQKSLSRLLGIRAASTELNANTEAQRQLSIKRQVTEKKAKVLLGGGEDRIKAQHDKVSL